MSVTKFDRQLYMLTALAGRKRGKTAEELHRELENDLGTDVTIRTIYRDIDDISAQFPISEEVRENKTYYFMLEKFTLDDIQCSFHELMALMLMNKMMENMGNDPVVEGGRKLTQRLISKLPEHQRGYLGGIYEHFRVELPSSQVGGAGAIQTFFDAVHRNTEVRISYQAFNSDEISQRVIHPYAIYFKHQYYVVAWCTERCSIREFRLDRIIDVELLDTSFKPDPSFDYTRYSRSSWDLLKGDKEYNVVLRFVPQVSRFIQEYHGDKADSLCPLPEGSLEFRKSVSALDEIFSWILSHGPDVEVVEPVELKDRVQESIKEQAIKLGLI